MKGIQSKHLRKKLRDRRLKLTSAGSYNRNFDLTIRITNIAPKWKYGLRYAKGNIYKMDSWEEMRVNIVVSGVHKERTYTQSDNDGTDITIDVPITEWNENNSTWGGGGVTDTQDVQSEILLMMLTTVVDTVLNV